MQVPFQLDQVSRYAFDAIMTSGSIGLLSWVTLLALFGVLVFCLIKRPHGSGRLLLGLSKGQLFFSLFVFFSECYMTSSGCCCFGATRAEKFVMFLWGNLFPSLTCLGLQALALGAIAWVVWFVWSERPSFGKLDAAVWTSIVCDHAIFMSFIYMLIWGMI